MNIAALATDYDGTLAHDSVVDVTTVNALRRFSSSGRKLILVTGRELGELLVVFPLVALFDLVVAENGALLYWPQTKKEKLLCKPADAFFVNELRVRGVKPLSAGRAIVATRVPYEKDVLEVLNRYCLNLHIILNKGAVMVLPLGVNKQSGLTAALNELGLPMAEIIGVGDAENDYDFLKSCGCSVAVDNALGWLKERVDLVTKGARGAGVTELINGVLAQNLF